MTPLKCNFTNQDQSKRLLELGVPADSADCFLARFGIDEDWKVKALNNVKYSEISISNQEYCLPCWSVGRLIEIYEICTQRKFNRRNQTDNLVYLSPLEDVLMQIEHNACGFNDNTK